MGILNKYWLNGSKMENYDFHNFALNQFRYGEQRNEFGWVEKKKTSI